MKKIILTLLTIVLFCANSNAQRGSKEKIKALKIAFITEQLELTKKEAEQFWPIYNKYDSTLHYLRSTKYRVWSDKNVTPKKLEKEIKKSNKRRFKRKSYKDQIKLVDSLTENDISYKIKTLLIIEKKVYQEKEMMVNALSKIISYKKIMKLQMAEHEFNRKLMRRLRGSKRKN